MQNFHLFLEGDLPSGRSKCLGQYTEFNSLKKGKLVYYSPSSGYTKEKTTN